LYCSSGSTRGKIVSAAVCRFSASKGGDSPFAVPVRPGSASQSLGQPFSIRSEPALPHQIAPSSRCSFPIIQVPCTPEFKSINAQLRGVRRGVGSNSAIDTNSPHHIRKIFLGSWFVASPLGQGEDTGLPSEDPSKGVGATVGLGVGEGWGRREQTQSPRRQTPISPVRNKELM
jgi:hypothetical protein